MMDERKFLEKIRKLQESGKRIGLTEMKDVTPKNDNKKQLIESYLKPGFIIEDHPLDDVMDTKVVDEEEGQDISSDEQRDEENAFKDTVSKLVKFKKIKVYKENVEWSGSLVRERINWVYSLEDQVACYISTDDGDLLQLTDNVLEVIKKIRAYYDIWSDEWSGRLTGGPMGDDDDMDDGEIGGDF